MRLKNIPGSRERIQESKYLVKEQPAQGVDFVEDEGHVGRMVLGAWAVKGHWNDVFGDDAPICIEIGMGKGTFLMENARENPHINYVGIEKYSSVILRAIQKQDEEQLPNVRFIRMDAEYICDVFDEGEVSKIYLNFSDPWPKARHARRRLTSTEFLGRYTRILKDAPSDMATEEGKDNKADTFRTGVIEFKTDNKALFDFSLEEAKEAGWPILAYTHDLHADAEMSAGNIMTEYEKKFSALGQKICKMIIKKP